MKWNGIYAKGVEGLQMNREKNPYIVTEGINVIQLFLLGYYNLYTFDLGACHGSGHYPFLMIFAVLFSFWSRCRLERLELYQSSRCLIFLYGGLIGRNKAEKILFLLFSFVIVIVSWYRQLQVKNRIHIERIGFGWILLVLPAYLYMKVYKTVDTSEILFYICMIYIWLCYLNQYQASREKYLINNEKTAAVIQKTEIRKNGNRWIRGVLGSMLVALIWESGLYFREIEEKIGGVMFRFLSWIFGFIKYAEVEKSEEGLPVPTPTPAQVYEDTEAMPVASQWLKKFFKLLEGGLEVIAGFLIVLAVIGAIGLVIYGIWRAFYQKERIDGEKIMDTDEVRIEKIKNTGKTKKKKKGRRFFRTNQEKIRYTFYKEITEYKNGEIRQSMTANELTKQVRDERKGVVEKILPIYQKARYSQYDTEKNELDKMMEYRKNL